MKGNVLKYLMGILLVGTTVLYGEMKVGSLNDVAEKLEIEASEDEIVMCTQTSDNFDSSDGLSAKPYVSISPKQHFGLRINYKSICITGLKPRTEYKVTIHKDIPLGKEFRLDNDYTLNFATQDLKPSYNFPQTGYILPANKDISIPINTRNVKKIELSLYRINTNNLIGVINTYGFFRTLSDYELERIENTDGYLLWSKKLPIASNPNEMVTTAVPIGDTLKQKDTGVYILRASILDDDGNAIYNYDAPTQWFMISDIGLYSLQSSKGLHIYTKSLATAEAYDDVKLELIAKNNEVLQTVKSEEGIAFFSKTILEGKKGLAPKAIYAYGEKGDFSVLDLSRPAHDLSDRGVEGRENRGRYDAFVYSNRGIFKPSESITFHALIKDKEGVGQPNLPLSVKVTNAQGEEVYAKMLKTDAVGHIEDTIQLSASAATGKWEINLFAGTEKPIGNLSFLVEDFIPPKIKIEVGSSPSKLKLNQKSIVGVDVSYLTGSVLPNAAVEVNTILHQAKNPFKEYGNFHFGNQDENFANTALPTQTFKADANGHLDIPILIEQISNSTLPVAAHIDIAASEPGGRAVHKALLSFIEDKDVYIGIKPMFEGDAVDMGVAPLFEVVSIHEGKPFEEALEYKLIREEEHWHWRWDSEDEWEYYTTYSDAEELAEGSIVTSATKPTSFKLNKLDWGSYRIEIRDQKNHLTTYRFSSGYQGGNSKASPDRLPVSVDKQRYAIDDTLKVNVTAKFTGPALVSIANHEIIQTKEIMLEASKTEEVSFDVESTWGSSAYVLVSAFRPQSKHLGANRAIGIAHIAIDRPEEKLTLTLEHPAKISSKRHLDVVVKAKEYENKEIFLTLAAVDEGVLNLTGYQPANPEAYFFGQQKLGVEIRDIYGELIEPEGAHGAFEVGADGELAETSSQNVISNRQKVVALFSQAVSMGSKGEVKVPLEIPDYQGALKLMVVAWSKEAVGSASSKIIIKDPISAEYYMPSFISVGDDASTLLTLDFDKSVPEGKYDIRLSTQGGVSLETTKYSYEVSQENKKATFEPKLSALSNLNEEGKILLDVLKDGKVVVHREWEIGIRSRYAQGYVKRMGSVGVNETLNPATLIDSAVWSQTKKFNLKLSSWPLLPVASLSQELYDYSCRCGEQTTSRAFPMLFLPKSKRDEKLINYSIEKVLSYQKYNGGFGLWENSEESMWVGAYILDFLTRAKKEGYEIPQERIDKGLSWLKNNLNKWSNHVYEQEADVYALYVLARWGEVLISEMNFYAEDKNGKIKSAQAWAQLGSAYAYVGEKKKAQEMFQKAQTALGTHYTNYFYSNYGGSLRDEAALVMLMRESGLSLDWESRYAQLVKNVGKRSYFSTQEMSVLLRVAYSINQSKGKLQLMSGDKTLPIVNGEYEHNATTQQALELITNKGNASVWYDFTYQGTPISAQYLVKDNDGFSLSKTLYTMDGKELNASEGIKQNERIVVVIKGRIENSNIQEPLISDWYCAGLEPENPEITGIDPTSALSWLGGQTPTISKSYRNDRFEAALKKEAMKENTFVLAYVARAVSKGAFTLPPVKVEDMYQPYYRAYSNFLQHPLQIVSSEGIATTPLQPKVETMYGGLTEGDFESVHARALSKGDLNKYDKSQLKLLRNALIARYGYDYRSSSPQMHEIFSHFAWYKPTNVTTAEVIDQLMPPYVKANVILMIQMEKEK